MKVFSNFGKCRHKFRIIIGKFSDEISTLTDSHKSYVLTCLAQVGIRYKCGEIYRPV